MRSMVRIAGRGKGGASRGGDQVERAEAAGLSGPQVHVRRMLVLLGFGVAHFYLIWFGDILTLYAASGLIAFLFRRLPVQRLIALGAAFLLVSMLIFGLFIFTQYQADIAAHAPGATRDAIKQFKPFVRDILLK